MCILSKIESQHMIQWFQPNDNIERSWNHYTMYIPLKIESQHMIQWFLLLGNAAQIVEPLYHDDTAKDRIERHDSMVPSARQRRTDCGTIIPFLL